MLRGPRKLLPTLLIVAYCLLGAAWVMANPAGYHPDEPAHYTKAVGVGQLDFAGTPAKYGIGPGFGPQQLKWINQAARSFNAPRGRLADGFACSIFNPALSAKCLNGYSDRTNTAAIPRSTYVGSYEPFLYLPAGLAANISHDPIASLYDARIANASIAFAFLSVAILLLWSGSAWSLLGMIVATSPMVLFMASGLAPSGPEIGAALCFLACVIRFGRPEPPTRALWVATAASGTVLLLSRSLGFGFLGLYLVLFVAMNGGPKHAWALARSGKRASSITGVLLLAAAAAEAVWQVTEMPHVPLQLGETPTLVSLTVQDLPRIAQEVVGVFGWASIGMPPLAYPVWGVMVTALVVTAGVAAPVRDRRLILGSIALAVLATFVVAYLPYGYFTFYGRYVLAVWISVPIVAGEVLRRNVHRLILPPKSLLVLLPLAAAAVQITGWWRNGKSAAVSLEGPGFFPPVAQWSPPLGWWPWIAVACVAVLSMAAFAVLAWRTDDTDDRAVEPSAEHHGPVPRGAPAAAGSIALTRSSATQRGLT